MCELAHIRHQFEGEQDAQRGCCLAQVWAESGQRESDYREAIADKQLFPSLEPDSFQFKKAILCTKKDEPGAVSKEEHTHFSRQNQP